MHNKKKELTISEQLLLDSMQITTVCPKCGRAVLITPKDLYWYMGVTIVHADGTKEHHEGGWHSDCKCGQAIPVDIIMRAKKCNM